MSNNCILKSHCLDNCQISYDETDHAYKTHSIKPAVYKSISDTINKDIVDILAGTCNNKWCFKPNTSKDIIIFRKE